MCLFKKWRAKRAAKKKLKQQAKEVKHQEVVLKEEKVVVKKTEPLKEQKDQKVKEQVKTAEKAAVEPVGVNDEEEKTPRETKPKYHVSQNKNKNNPNFKRWGVKLSSSTKTIKYHDTQAEAIKHAEQLAKSNDTTYVIHKVDGKIRKQNY